MGHESAGKAEGGRRKGHLKATAVLLGLFALAGFCYGLAIDDERRSRLRKLAFEGREMWFRIFV